MQKYPKIAKFCLYNYRLIETKCHKKKGLNGKDVAMYVHVIFLHKGVSSNEFNDRSSHQDQPESGRILTECNQVEVHIILRQLNELFDYGYHSLHR
jgi:hypothetical protein